VAERGKKIGTWALRDKAHYSSSGADLNNQVADADLEPGEEERDCAVGTGR